MPKGTYMWAYPYAQTTTGILEVGSRPPTYEESDEDLGPGGIIRENNVCRDENDQTACWVEPEGARDSGNRLERLRDGTTGSTKTTVSS